MIIGLFAGFFYFSNAEFQRMIIEDIAKNEINFIQTSFENIKQRDINALSSTLNTIALDSEIKKIFLEKDRDKLYSYNETLFTGLKEDYGITHWYFILPDGEAFLRMHEKEIYGDKIDRYTFNKARDTQRIASGVELGKTAFALRVVMPYFEGEELIGYVELGEEMDHFLKIIKSQTENETGIVADKEHLNQLDWVSTMQTMGRRDSWDDLSEHVLVSSTVESSMTKKCFTEDNTRKIEQEITETLIIKDKERVFGCGGFEIEDADGQHSGSVLMLVNVTDHLDVSKQINRNATLYLGVILSVGLVLSFLFSASISGSIKKLSIGSNLISNGNLDYRVNIETGDEIEQLGKDFNEMAHKVKQSHTELEVKIRQRTKELQKAKTSLEEKVKERTKELEQSKENVEQQIEERTAELKKTIHSLEIMNQATLERELKMIELKKKIKEMQKVEMGDL